MDAREHGIIRKNLTFLLDNLDVSSVRYYLYEKSVLNTDDMEILSMTTSTRFYKNEVFLLHILPKRGKNAYAEFIKALRHDGHYEHVVEALENTQLSSEELEKMERTQRERFVAVQKQVDKMYERIQSERRKTKHLVEPRITEGGADHLMSQRTFSNPSGGLDEPDGVPAPTLPPNHFGVKLEANETSEKCGFQPGPYILRLTVNGIALIPGEDAKNDNAKADWAYNVIRQYGSGQDRFVLEVGRRAATGQGMFYFRTASEEEGEAISATIKKFTQSIKKSPRQ